MQRYLSFSLIAALAAALPAHAEISAAEAAKLGGPELTETGAIKAGNADGSIPAYGGKRVPDTKPPASAGKFNYGDAYADEKPLYTIDAKNMAQYADKLTDGMKELLAKKPSFHINVYPTHRDQYFPQDVMDNTPKCAQTAKVVGNGDGIVGARRCIPFPIPKTGYEAMRNSRLQIGVPPKQRFSFKIWLIDAAGNHTLASANALYSQIDFNDAKGSGEPLWQLRLLSENLAPAGKVGSKDMRWTPIRMDEQAPRAWQYIPGQRRVRLAPEFQYDTVSTQTGGLNLFDEINMFDGKMDRFDFSSLKLREMIVPFNTAKTQFESPEKTDAKSHPGPDTIRWELRRVYEVNAPRKPNARHVQQRKVFYIDQDSWTMVAYDAFDQAGRISRGALAFPYLRTDIPVVNAQSMVFWDFTKGIWGWMLNFHDGSIKAADFSDNVFEPDNLAGSGVR